MKTTTSELLFDEINNVHKKAVVRIKSIMRSLKLKSINLRYFRVEWDLDTLPTIFDTDRHGFAMALKPYKIELTRKGLRIYADDEGGSVTYSEDGLIVSEMVFLLQAIEDIRNIIKDPDNKDDIDWTEVA